MNFRPECQELLQFLEQATSRLAGLNPEDFKQVARAIEERRHAVEAMARWIAAEHSGRRPVAVELAAQLERDFERGADALVRLALARAATLRDLKSLNRERQLLHSLGAPAAFKPTVIDYQG